MNKSNRIILSLFGFVLTFVSITFFLKFLYYKEIDSLYRITAGIVLGLLVFAILYLNSKSDSKSLSIHIISGGVTLGFIGFIIGFIGPIIIDSSANQGPLLGIFVTGPIGYLAGLLGGAIFWKFKK